MDHIVECEGHQMEMTMEDKVINKLKGNRIYTRNSSSLELLGHFIQSNLSY